MILKMNFNFNFKDMPGAAEASMCDLTNARDRHHTGKSGIKRLRGAITRCAVAPAFVKITARSAA